MRPPPDFSLYVVTNRELARGRKTVEVVAEALRGGATAIQYREKRATFRVMMTEAQAIKELTVRHGACLIINDRVDLALAVAADGVHLGQKDMPLETARSLLGSGRIIGVSVQTVGEAVEAARNGADYVGISGVFPTTTKRDVGAVLGVRMIAGIAAAVTIPIVAIGGIKSANAASVIRAGASGIAVVSAVMAADDVAAACRELLGIIRQTRESDMD